MLMDDQQSATLSGPLAIKTAAPRLSQRVQAQKRRQGAQVVAGEDDDVLHRPVLDVLEQPGVLPHSVGRALEPLLVCGGLRGGQNLHKAVPSEPDPAAKVVGAGQVAIEGGAVELGQHVDFADAAVDAVGHGHIYEPVGAADGHGRLGPVLCEGVQAGASAATEDDGCTRYQLYVRDPVLVGAGCGRAAGAVLLSRVVQDTVDKEQRWMVGFTSDAAGHRASRAVLEERLLNDGLHLEVAPAKPRRSVTAVAGAEYRAT